MAQGRVLKHARDNDGNTIVKANENPILNRRECVVEFEDNVEAELATNTIAQSMYAQCDHDGHDRLSSQVKDLQSQVFGNLLSTYGRTWYHYQGRQSLREPR